MIIMYPKLKAVSGMPLTNHQYLKIRPSSLLSSNFVWIHRGSKHLSVRMGRISIELASPKAVLKGLLVYFSYTR